MFSKGILLSSLQFLKTIKTIPWSIQRFMRQKSYLHTTPDAVIKLLMPSGMILEYNGFYHLSTKGEGYLPDDTLFSFFKTDETKETIRSFLKETILHVKPQWATHLYKGRREWVGSLEDGLEKRELLELFQSLDLLEGSNDSILSWWDSLAQAFAPSSERNLEIGREGEKRSILYEEYRVGKKPYWEALESNFSGYDLLSVTDRGEDTPLRIECKASRNSYRFHVSRREWEKAVGFVEYLFHFWHLGRNELFVLPVPFLKGHIPIEQGKGVWENSLFSFSREELVPFLAPIPEESSVLN
ncbi:protein NO VEIN domain-containing protein [Peribacillus frigoritolerans]|uniref:protein NO VEIN domain-containing protein n=1 Tax=Peribacillus frigoritolerans TaxID=450367 RepID=UPI003D34253A